MSCCVQAAKRLGANIAIFFGNNYLAPWGGSWLPQASSVCFGVDGALIALYGVFLGAGLGAEAPIARTWKLAEKNRGLSLRPQPPVALLFWVLVCVFVFCVLGGGVGTLVYLDYYWIMVRPVQALTIAELKAMDFERSLGSPAPPAGRKHLCSCVYM